MAAPDPEGISLVAKVAGGFAASLAAVGGFVKLWNMKADKSTVNDQFQKVENELSVQRGHIAKVFDKLGDAEVRNEERHRELMMHLLRGRE